jgi:hypothetical protein
MKLKRLRLTGTPGPAPKLRVINHHVDDYIREARIAA